MLLVLMGLQEEGALKIINGLWKSVFNCSVTESQIRQGYTKVFKSGIVTWHRPYPLSAILKRADSRTQGKESSDHLLSSRKNFICTLKRCQIVKEGLMLMDHLLNTSESGMKRCESRSLPAGLLLFNFQRNENCFLVWSIFFGR